MRFIDIFIKNPVLAFVISALILVAGIGSAFMMQVSEYPQINDALITITTSYPGANPKIIQGFITSPLEHSVAGADGIDYMSSRSTLGSSDIEVKTSIDANPNIVLSQVVQKVNAVLSQLPKGTESPSINMTTGDTFPSFVFVITAKDKTATVPMMTAYAQNELTPELEALGGVAQVRLVGSSSYAMRIWLNYKKMAAFNVTPSDVANALKANSTIAAGGEIKGPYYDVTVIPTTNLSTVDQYNDLAIKNVNGRIVRIKDIGKAELGRQDYTTNTLYNGQVAIFSSLLLTPSANILDVERKIKQQLPIIRSSLPKNMNINLVYTGASYVHASIREVLKSLIEAVIIVILVIFLFTGSIRSTIIPIVSIPLAIIGSFSLMALMGFSFNLLSFLAIILAIGLVADDGIVVLENIHRHIEEGLPPFKASIKGAREIASPLILMASTIVVVFIPIGLVGGLTGQLFIEFAYTLIDIVIISVIVAYTFSPMLCSKIITQASIHKPMVIYVDKVFSKVKNGYLAVLKRVVNIRIAMLLIVVAVFGCVLYMFVHIPSDLAPTEDQGIIGIKGIAPSASNIHYLESEDKSVNKLLSSYPESVHGRWIGHGFPVKLLLFSGVFLKPWDERKQTQMELQPKLQKALNQFPGFQFVTFTLPPLPGSDFGPPIEYVIQTSKDYDSLNTVAGKVVAAMMASKKFLFAKSDLLFDNDQVSVNIDRNKAAELGISMSDLANDLSYSYSGGYVNYFDLFGYGYQVIPEMLDSMKLSIDQLKQLQLKTKSGAMVPLSSIATFEVQPSIYMRNRFQGLNSATIFAVPAEGITQGDAINYLQNLSKTILPKGYMHTYVGSSRSVVQNSNQMLYAFLFAIIIIYLVLAAQFESFRDPFVILITVPMSIFGALLPLYIGKSYHAGFASLNIYSQVGLITLIGLISKHGILLVEFANKEQLKGKNKIVAILSSAELRVRPILMTTAAMVVGVLPLVFASGAGAVGRQSMGMIICFGMLIGTIFTLFIVPIMYIFLAQNKQKLFLKKQRQALEIKSLEQDN
ncbi:efflux RND transporter permease subunit [Cysteiniphilum halobium]|uniref:efflux RND transporter permease subunit n=1 Tax=Cysteiniphilum halobium TaxID=2219059 RepID=UPI0013C3473E|nr:efflux RND transporter permease subunit [Cysteiniphilum halobium]